MLLLSTCEAAQVLSVSPQTVRNRTRRGQLAPLARTLGGRLLFDPETVSSFVAEKETPSTGESVGAFLEARDTGELGELGEPYETPPRD